MSSFWKARAAERRSDLRSGRRWHTLRRGGAGVVDTDGAAEACPDADVVEAGYIRVVGKPLLIGHGTLDFVVSTSESIGYKELVEKVLGPDLATQLLRVYLHTGVGQNPRRPSSTPRSTPSMHGSKPARHPARWRERSWNNRRSAVKMRSTTRTAGDEQP